MSISEIENELLDAIIRDYDVGNLVSHSVIEGDMASIGRRFLHLPASVEETNVASSGRSAASEIFRLDAQSGSYCLKSHRSDVAQAHVALEESLIVFFSEVGYSLAPQLVATRTGSYHVEKNGTRWWLSRFIEAEPAYLWMVPSWRNHACFVAGRALAAWHHTTDGLNAEVLNHWSCSNSNGAKSAPIEKTKTEELVYLSVLPSLERQLDDCLALSAAKLCGDELRDDPLLNFLTENGYALKEVLASAAEHVEEQRRMLGVLELLVHGDYHPGNLLFRENQDEKELVGVVDFEHVRLEDPVFDLAYAAVMFCSVWANDIEDFTQGNASFSRCFNKGSQSTVDPRLLRSLFMGYFDTLKEGLRQGGILKLGRINRFTLMHRVTSLFGPYMELSSFLILIWLIERYLTVPEKMRPVFLRSSIHILNLLFFLARECKTRRDWLKDVPRK